MGILGLFEKMAEAERFIDRVTPKVSIDTFLESVGDTVDDDIKRIEAEEGLYFLGGKMHFTLSGDERKIMLRAEMYFQTSGGSFQKHEKNGEYFVTMLNQNAYETFLAQIYQQGEVVIEISVP